MFECDMCKGKGMRWEYLGSNGLPNKGSDWWVKCIYCDGTGYTEEFVDHSRPRTSDIGGQKEREQRKLRKR
jgi:hypothetical protein